MTRLILPAMLLALAACGAADPAATAPSASMEGPDPRMTLQHWADALENRDWAAAYDTWSGDGAASGMDAETYASSYEQYRTIRITLGEGHVEGAAGSLYYETGVTMSGETKDGISYRFQGPVTLRRVNDVPGATKEQLEWHIVANGLAPVEP